MTLRALGIFGGAALAAATAIACGDTVSLGDPDAEPDGGWEPPLVPRQACPPRPPLEPQPLAQTDPGWGEARAIAMNSVFVYLLFERASPVEGVLARVALAGGPITELARIGGRPSALAADELYAYVGTLEGEIHRLPYSGPEPIERNHTWGVSVNALAADGRGRAFFAHGRGRVSSTGFGVVRPLEVAGPGFEGVSALAYVGNRLYVTGPRYVAGIDVRYTLGQPPLWRTERCGFGAIAVLNESVYCADRTEILRLDAETGTIKEYVEGQVEPRHVAVAAGRMFWMTTASDARRSIMTKPLDGVGDPSVAAVAEAGSELFAANRCGLVFLSGPTLFLRGL